MTAVARASRSPLAWRSWARSLVQPGPERWVHVVALAGWVVLIVHAAWSTGLVPSPAPASTATGMHDMPGMAGTSHHPAALGPAIGWLVPTLMWLAMLAATMLPLAAPNLRYLGLHSSRRRQTLATVDAGCGWLLVWGVPAGLAAASWLLTRAAGPVPATVVAFSGAIAWQTTRRKRIVTARCHRTLAPPLDATASVACRRYGVQLGTDCATSCWAIMGAMAVSGHELLVVVPLAWVTWYERRRSHHVPTTKTTVLVLAGAGLVAVARAALTV